MSQWGNDSQTTSTGKVAFYDPTKFQKNAAAEYPSQNNDHDGAAVNQHATEQPQGDQQQQQNSWNAWGGWDAGQYGNFGMNPDGSSVAGQGLEQQPYEQPGLNQWSQQMPGQWDPASGQQWAQPVYAQPGTEAGQNEGYDPNQHWGGQVATSFPSADANGHAADPNGYYYSQDGQFANVPSTSTGEYGYTFNQQHHQQQPNDARSHIRENGGYTSSTLQPGESENVSAGHNGTSAGFSGDGQVEEMLNSNDMHNQPVILGEHGTNNTETVGEVPVEGTSVDGTSVDGTVEGSGNVEEMSDQFRQVSLSDHAQLDNIPTDTGFDGPGVYQQEPQQRNSPFIQQPETVSTFIPQSAHNAEHTTEEALAHEKADESQSKRQVPEDNPPFSDWEMVNNVPVGSHSRNASLDNSNVHFFISSTNSSARVSPAAAAKTDHPDTGSNSATKLPEAGQVVSQGGAVVAQASEHPQGPLPPEAFAIAPTVLGPATSVNPYRRSPNTLTHSSSNNEVSLLSSTQLDVTKPNYENSPRVLIQSISPIPNTSDTHSNRNQEHIENISPDIQTASSANTGDNITDTPLSSTSKKTVPQSPITARKESAFQPPKPKDRNKPVRASHDIPGITPQETKASDVKTEAAMKSAVGRDGRRTPERDSNRRQTSGRRTPDWDSDRRGNGRRTPDWDSDRRGNGRRTPDWDSDRRPAGRNTPDWDNDGRNKRTSEKDGDFKRPGRRTPDWDSSRREDRERDRYGRDRDSDRLSSRPPPGSSSKGPRARQSAFHTTQANRAKHNESPATTLWDEPDNLSVVSNILLVAASGDSSAQQKVPSTAPSVLTPVASLITSMSEQIKTDEPTNEARGKNDAKNSRLDDEESVDARDNYQKRDSKYGRGKERDTREDVRRNRSSENLLDRDGRGTRDRGSRNNSRERGSMYGSRSSLDLDDTRDSSRGGDSRDRSYRDRDDYSDRYRYRDRDRDRPTSRAGSTIDGHRRDYRDRDKGDYRDRDRERDYRRTDRYDRDRPRSRHGDRPSSRHGETDRPKSRTDHERDAYYRERYGGRGYDYDEYYRRGGSSHYGSTYDRQYYDYYYGNYNQSGYYDEHGYYHHPDTTPRFEYPPDLQDYSRGQGYDDYYSYYNQDQTYNGYRWDPHVSEWVLTTPEVVPQRSTPEKFMIAHTRACFGPNGQLIQVLPNRPADGQPATVEIHSVEALLEETEEAEELRQFPGPLVKGDTHKNDVLMFCQRKAKACMENMDLNDRDSAELIWRFLELLIKQNGTVVGTDIAHLILEGHEPTTLDYCKTGVRIRSQSVDNLDPEDDGSSDGGQRLSNRTTPIDRSIINRSGKSVEDVTDRFRHLLMYGMKKDALDWSMKNNLWGHALFLASKMDSKAHATVMTRFANVAMRMNDPLQTLYQLMSGRQPAAVTSMAEERWGDWRPHLAMILSNHTQRPELDRKSITTLGDTLASRGFLHASHFCYLMSQTGFGSYNKKSSKIVLIGASHGLPLLEFVSNEAVQCTEIYEYALALGNTSINVSNFQYFKYLYATRLADCGFAQEALHYCEVIAKNINLYPALYTVTLVKLVYELSNQLKYADPRRQDEAEDEARDPDWLRELHTTLVQFEEGAIQSMSGAVTPAFLPGTSASSESGEVGMYLQGTDHNGAGPHYSQDGSYLPNSGMMYNTTMDQTGYQAQDATDGQYQYQQQQQEHQHVPQMSQPSQEAAMTGEAGHMTTGAGNQYQQQMGDNSYQTGYQQSQQTGTDGYQYGQLQWPTQQQAEVANQMPGQESANQNHVQTESTNQNHQDYYQQYGTNHNAGNWSHDQQHQQPHNPQHTGFPPDLNLGESLTSTDSRDSNKRSSLASVTSVSEDGEDTEDGLTESNASQPSVFDIQAPQQKIIPPRLRKRTTSECSTEGANQDKNKSQAPKQDSIVEDKKNGKGKGGGGIWNKLGGLFGGSRKNEMKLPDDKEPSIVWDEANKKWVDKDGGEQAETVSQPPPKDADISGPAPSQAPPGPQGFSNTLPPTGNKFSRRKTFGARGQYVDVMNPKPAGGGASVPSNLFHTLPSSHSAPAIFNPGGLSDTSSTEQRQEPIPEEKNHQSGAHNSDAPPAQSQPFPQQLSAPENAPPGPPSTAPLMPTMFNPSQFQGSQSFKQPAPAPGHRHSNRRVYPK